MEHHNAEFIFFSYRARDEAEKKASSHPLCLCVCVCALHLQVEGRPDDQRDLAWRPWKWDGKLVIRRHFS